MSLLQNFADAILWSSGVDRSSSISESVTSPTSTNNFYGAESDDSDDEGDKKDTSKKKDKAKDAVAVSDGLADLSIGDSTATEYEMHDDHKLLISKALQLLQVNDLSSNNGACGIDCAKAIWPHYSHACVDFDV